MTEQNKKAVFLEQVNKIEKVLDVLRTQFGEEFEDEVRLLGNIKR